MIRECGNEVVDRTALFNSRLRAAGDGGDGDGVKNRDVPLFLPSFLFDPLSSLSSLFVLSGHKTPFAKRRCDDDAIKEEGLDKEARQSVRQRQILFSKDNILRSSGLAQSKKKCAPNDQDTHSFIQRTLS